MNTWHIKEISPVEYFCEDGQRSLSVTNEHCPACVYAHLVTKYGGNVDLRGLHRYHNCFPFLSTLVAQERERERAKAKA